MTNPSAPKPPPDDAAQQVVLAGPWEEGQPQEEFCCHAAQAPHIDGHGVWVAQHHLRWRQGRWQRDGSCWLFGEYNTRNSSATPGRDCLHKTAGTAAVVTTHAAASSASSTGSGASRTSISGTATAASKVPAVPAHLWGAVEARLDVAVDGAALEAGRPKVNHLDLPCSPGEGGRKCECGREGGRWQGGARCQHQTEAHSRF